jgi:hypothetical protein
MATDEGNWDDGLYDENGNPLYPDRIYVPAIAEPCTQAIRLSAVEEEPDEFQFGVFELQYAIYLGTIAAGDRYGRLRFIVSVVLPSIPGIDDADAFGTFTLVPGAVTIRLPSIQPPECD